MGSEMNKSEMPKKIKLIYFDVRARAEGARLNLAYAALPYEDVRYKSPFDPTSNWSEIKPTTPWGSLPVLEVDGTVIGQSITIARYLAKLTGIYGANLVEQAKYDAIVDACLDVLNLGGPWLFEKDAKAKEEKENDIRQKLTVLLNQLEKVLGKDKFFGGSKLSWADLQFYSLMEMYKFLGFEDIFTDNKSITALIRNIEDIPRIKQYLANRKFTKF